MDVVYIALPNHLHAEWTIRALEAGKHVLCEKPLALTVAEVDDIADAAERTGRIAVEAFMYLHSPQTRQAVELARGGTLGKLELLNGTFSFFLTYPDDPRIDPTKGGGSLWDVGCYPVSLSRRIAGEEPDEVHAFARFDERGVDRTFIGQLHFPGGLLAQFDSGFAAPYRQRVEIVGSDATLVLDAPFLTEPDGPPPSITVWRDREPTSIAVELVDQYRSRGRGPHRGDPRWDPAHRGPSVQPRRDRRAGRSRPRGAEERRSRRRLSTRGARSMDQPATPPPPDRSKRQRAVAIVAGVALVAVVVGGLAVTRPWQPESTCPIAANDHPEWSVARRWDEALLDAIRRALPNPPVHARNLFHTSVAMWDAWAAYDQTAGGVIFKEKHTASDVAAARDEAISYAAYDVLTSRFLKAVGGAESISEFADVMDTLCYPLDVKTTDGDTPAAVGNRIAAAVLAYGLTDGSNQANGYAADYMPVNAPLVVAKSGTTMADPNRWQPLQLEHMISQNGIPVENGVQQAVGPHWGHVKGFALAPAGDGGVPIDPGPPPQLGGDAASDQAYKDQAVEVIRDSSQLDPADGVTIDISPAVRGNNPLGSNAGQGHAVNPATGKPYAPDLVNQGDYARALTEFWADGPKSETPPGHWNVVANTVSDELDPNLRIGGTGAAVDRLQWDVKLYLALNGATHDAAIAAWGLKGRYDSVRPISMIRYMGGLGQSSDPSLPSYDTNGLPLVPGLVEVITLQTTAAGGRHAALAGHEGEIAIKAWSGNPKDPKTETGGVAWILAVDWVPYQLETFVTPSFQGYASGHSTFSRAAAEVLTGFTGSEYVPGGLDAWTTKPGELKVESGPTAPVTLQWATYYDAADMAGQSRLYGGIHIQADDFNGRDGRVAMRHRGVGARAAVLRGSNGPVTGRGRARRGLAGSVRP